MNTILVSILALSALPTHPNAEVANHVASHPHFMASGTQTYAIEDPEEFSRHTSHADYTRLEVDWNSNRFRFIDDGFYGSNSPYFPMSQHIFDGRQCIKVQGVFDIVWTGDYELGGKFTLYCKAEDRLEIMFGPGLPGWHSGGYVFKEAPVAVGTPQIAEEAYAGIWKYSDDSLCGIDCRIEINVAESLMTVSNASYSPSTPIQYPITIVKTGTTDRGNTVLHYENARGKKHFWRIIDSHTVIDDRGDTLTKL